MKVRWLAQQRAVNSLSNLKGETKGDSGIKLKEVVREWVLEFETLNVKWFWE